MNNSPTIVSDDDPAAALLKCLQAQLSSSPQSSSKEEEHRTSVTVAKYEDVSKKMIDMSNPFYAKSQNGQTNSDFRKKIAFFEESLNPKKSQENDRRKFPLLKKTSIKEKDIKYKKTKFKNNTVLQEAFTSIIKEIAEEIKFNCNSLKIQDDSDSDTNFSLFSNVKKFNQDSNIVVYKAWNILIENKKFYELESDTNNHTVISKKENDEKVYSISSSQTNFISTMQTFSFNLDTSKLKQKKEKPKLKFDIFLKQSSIVSNGQNESPLFTEESEDLKSTITKEINSLHISSPSPKKNKKNSSCSVRSVRNVKKYEDILTRAKLNNTSGKKGHRNTSCDNINITTYTSNYAKKNNSELILYLYEVYAKIEKSLKTNVDTKKILLRLKSKIQSVILQIKSNEKKGKFCLIEEKKEDKESKENGKANLCLKSHLILLKLFDVPKKVMYGDNEENCAINDVEYLTKIKSEEKIVISDFHINIVRSFFETLLMRLKIVNSKGVNIKYKKV